MGRETVYCSICGERIPPEHLEKGIALKLELRCFCKKCINDNPNVPTLVTDNVSPFYKPTPKREPAPAAVRKPATRQGPVHREPPPPAAEGGSSARFPLWFGLTLGIIPVIGVVVVLLWPSGAAPEPKPPAPASDAGKVKTELEAVEKRDAVVKRAMALAENRDFEGAVKALEEFPAALKETRAQAGIDEARAEIAKLKGAVEKRPWVDLFDDAEVCMKAEQYEKAKNTYKAALATAPSTTPTDKETHQRWQMGHFHLAQVYARETKLDACFQHLTKVFDRTALNGQVCKCQKTCLEQLKMSDAWTGIRSDPRYSALIESVQQK